MKRRKYRSKFERKIASEIKEHKNKIRYETLPLKYVKEHTYTPDFILDNGIIIEVKGRFTSADRSKHLAIKKTYPDLDIRFVFMNPNVKLNKTSRTTYGEWATKHGYEWSSGSIPKVWYKT